MAYLGIERVRTRWDAHVYAFYKPEVKIEYNKKGQRVHVFQCAGPRCKSEIRRNTESKDATSTGNLRTHVKRCWGVEALQAAECAKSFQDARREVQAYVRTGDITQSFARLGQGKVTYSTRQHTSVETR